MNQVECESVCEVRQIQQGCLPVIWLGRPRTTSYHYGSRKPSDNDNHVSMMDGEMTCLQSIADLWSLSRRQTLITRMTTHDTPCSSSCCTFLLKPGDVPGLGAMAQRKMVVV